MVLLGVIIGGLVAWHWKLVHVDFREWRFSVARLKRTRKIFYHHSARGVLVTAGAAIALWAVIKALRSVA